MTKDENSKPVVYRPTDDPLGIDPDKDFNEEAGRIARDALDGRHREAVQAEVDGALRRWGMKTETDPIETPTEIVPPEP